MRCPFCGQDKDKVIDSRATDSGRAIRRRRVCAACTKRFTTYEHIEASTRLTVIKKDGTRVPYDREKIINGVLKACYKRPVSDEVVNKLVDEAEEEIFKKHDREIAAMEIGRIVAERIKRIDQVAYVRFASVYKQFRDLDDLLDEVRDLLKSGGADTSGQGDLFSAP